MRILIPTVDYPPIEGGIASVSLHLARELAALEHEVTVVAPWFPDMDAFDAAEPVRVIRFHGYDRGWLRILPFARCVLPLLRDTDLLLAPNIAYGGLLGRWARLRHGKPYVCFAYAYEFLKFQRSRIARTVFRSVYRRALFTVAISKFSRGKLEEFAGRDVAVETTLPGAPAPVPVSEADIAAVRARFSLEGADVVLGVGRFIPRKGQALLIKAFAIVLEQYPTAHLVLAGRGPELEACRTKARALGIDGHVHCPGYVDDAALAALYATCTVFALATGEDAGGQVEGFGLVFAEAQARGKPVVAGRSGGTVDAVHHEKTGLLVRPDDAGAVAAALLRLLTDPALAARLGAAGRVRVEEELNWTAFTRSLMDAVEART
jgi:phosphatidylinositol alpha-1,6-mannosyltransferase